MEELADFFDGRFVEIAILLGDVEDIPPVGEKNHFNAEFFQRFQGTRKDSIEEHHEGVFDVGAAIAERLAKAHFAGAVRGQVSDQQNAVAFP